MESDSLPWIQISHLPAALNALRDLGPFLWCRSGVFSHQPIHSTGAGSSRAGGPPGGASSGGSRRARVVLPLAGGPISRWQRTGRLHCFRLNGPASRRKPRVAIVRPSEWEVVDLP